MTQPNTIKDDSDIGEARRETPYSPPTPPKTLRDEFAIAAMACFISSTRTIGTGNTLSHTDLASWSYNLADAMLERRTR